MAVITSAIVAVTAAAVSMGAVAAGVATVATVSTIAAVVGGIGLAVGVVGAVTKNKDLIKVGSIMGALGAGAGLGAMAASAMGLAPAAASSGVGAAGEATKSAAVSSAVETGKAGTVTAGGNVISQSTSSANTIINPTVGSGVTGGLQQTATTIPDAITGTAAQQAMNGANAATQVATNFVHTPGVDAPGTPTQGTQAPTQGVNLSGLEQEALGRGIVHGTQAPTVSPVPSAGMGDYTKGMLALGGMQVVGSALGGTFQGQSASKALELQKQQADREQAQRDLINSNNAYAPRIAYGRPSGLVGRA